MPVKIEIYTRRGCFYCARARMLLENKNVEYTHIPIDGDIALERLMIERANGGTSVPQIFINNTHIGGSDELYQLENEGRLDSLLEDNQK
ncbi:MAG: glutaredoxin 3 [Gammaproteobacteria bacterium]|nr:glutaredoxin 3 [Gammaproteobacteria bacterium]MDH5692559.1 glutaredoxin 3 [Gammaproteobacteria bacterium]